MEAERIEWNSTDGYTLDGQNMTFRRLPKDRKRIVAQVFNQGLDLYAHDYDEIVNLAAYYEVPLGDAVACVNYANKIVDGLNLWWN